MSVHIDLPCYLPCSLEFATQPPCARIRSRLLIMKKLRPVGYMWRHTAVGEGNDRTYAMDLRPPSFVEPTR